MKILGTKYQTYIDDKLVVLRLKKYNKDNNSYIFVDVKGRKVEVPAEEADKFVALSPDAIMNIMYTKSDNDKPDIYICVHNAMNTEDNIIPDIILRQDIYSYSKNWGVGNTIYVGDCLLKKTAPSEKDYKELMVFDNIVDSDSIVLYLDDTMESINSIINQKYFNKYDDVLKDIYDKQHKLAKGYCKSLIELMKDNNFITAYRSLFNITQLDFPIKIKGNYTDDGVITLNKKQVLRLEEVLQKYITDITVLEYDKDIDISKIVKNTHIVVSDSNEDIFIINYKVSGEMVHEETNDVMQAMASLLNNQR